ncbi:putative F-box protein At3g58910 [Papaver somniferum]|uniref:putative F-box protein At3g58910 n=1 Tax=Papaver somniferum TaxID=3469 RepID=UPI000E702363|nr:putative F-box protein At3g58910 [Papaver somniferum]
MDLGCIYPILDFPEHISFPRLKHLRLEHTELTNQCWSEKIFSNSPVLEELNLENCGFRDPSFCISIPTLKLLRIDGGHDIHKCSLKIQAPNLVSLYYTGYVAKEYVLSSFLTLEEAVVHLSASRQREEETGQVEAVRQFFRALTHVKCPTVKNPSLQREPSVYFRYLRPLKAAELELMVQIQSFPRASESCTFQIPLGSL